MKPEHHILQLHWIRAEQYCRLAGESIDTVRERIRDGAWAAGTDGRSFTWRAR